jgi:hypothetical protein
MLAVVGLALTAVGTILAIAPPVIGAAWATKDDADKERVARARYYTGISLIVIGTVVQIVAGWPI